MLTAPPGGVSNSTMAPDHEKLVGDSEVRLAVRQAGQSRRRQLQPLRVDRRGAQQKTKAEQ